MNRVAIYGCGAMGTVLGAFLAREGVDVDLVDVYREHVEKLNECGARLVGFEDFTQPVKALTPDQAQGVYDLVILFTKQTANAAAFAEIDRVVDENSTILTLQNGFPEPEVARHFGEDRTLGGAVQWGATFVGPGISEVTEPLSAKPVLFEIGTLSGEATDRVTRAAEVLRRMGPTAITPNLISSRWSKLLLNACMSGMSAALCSDFGGVIDSPKALRQLGLMSVEIGAVCHAAGSSFEKIGDFDVDAVLRNPGPQTIPTMSYAFSAGYANMRTAKASMLQDLEKGKPTEVDMIDGYVATEGRRLGVPTPVVDRVVEVVHGIEQGRYPMSFDENLALFAD